MTWSLLRQAVPAVTTISCIMVPAAAMGAEVTSVTLPGGTVIQYSIVLPRDYSADQVWPTLLVFPPGPQTDRMVSIGLTQWWEAEGLQRGFIILSPAAPRGTLYFRESRSLIRPFVEALLERYSVEGGRLHVGGISSGGISAFAAALDHPDLFRSVTVLPGFPPLNTDPTHLTRLSGITINMFVGQLDTVWLERMTEVREDLKRAGIDVHFEIIPGSGHTIGALAGAGSARLYDLIR